MLKIHFTNPFFCLQVEISRSKQQFEKSEIAIMMSGLPYLGIHLIHSKPQEITLSAPCPTNPLPSYHSLKPTLPSQSAVPQLLLLVSEVHPAPPTNHLYPPFILSPSLPCMLLPHTSPEFPCWLFLYAPFPQLALPRISCFLWLAPSPIPIHCLFPGYNPT